MNRFRILLAMLLLCASQAGHATEIAWLRGIYADTLNKANVRAGFAFYNPRQLVSARHVGRRFKYVDLEIGLEGTKLGMGFGRDNAQTWRRFGLSYADLQGSRLLGVETLMSAMGATLKLGYYNGLDGASDRFLLGIGVGF